MKKQSYYTFNMKSMSNSGANLTKAAFLGKSYTVVPVSMIVSGAYFPGGGDGEPTALFFDGEDLEKSKDTWNGRPASLGHPTDGITMNTPETFDKKWLGFVFNTRYDSGKKRLSAQLWLDDNRGDSVIDKVSNGQEIDVSIGAFGTVVPTSGTSNGVQYFSKFTEIRGDHLAVLPDGTGACSWGDGCGIRAEKKLADEKQSVIKDSVDINAGKEKENKTDCMVTATSTKTCNRNHKGMDMGKKKEAEGIEEVAAVVEAEESKVLSCDDIIKNPGKYDNDIVEAIKMRAAAKERIVKNLRAVEFEGGPICEKFLNSLGIADLGSLGALVNHYEAKLEAAAKVEAKETVVKASKAVVDYGLASGTTIEDKKTVEPKAIVW